MIIITDTDINSDLKQIIMPEIIPTPTDSLTTIVNLANRMVQLKEIEDGQASLLKKTQDEAKNIAEKLLPDLLATAGLTEINLVTGQKVKIKTDYFANISERNQDDAFSWLKERNMGALIKEEITVSSEAREALAAAEIPYSVSRSIHSSTLKAFVREMIEQNDQFPRELFGVHVIDKAVVK